MIELVNQIARIIIESPKRDERRDTVLRNLQVFSEELKNRKAGTADHNSRVAQFSKCLRPIDAFTPREMGVILILVSRVLSPLTRNLNSIMEMWNYLPGGRDFRPTEHMSWEEEVALRFDVLPYARIWTPNDRIVDQFLTWDLGIPIVNVMSTRELAKKMNAIGFSVKPTILYFKNEYDEVLGILSL